MSDNVRFGSKADINWSYRNVPFYLRKRTLTGGIAMSALCQKRTFRPSFDQLVGALLELEGYVKAERLRRLKIDDQLEFCWQLHWQLGRLCALKDAIDVTRGLPELLEGINTIGQQAAIDGVLAERKNCRHMVSGGQCDLFSNVRNPTYNVLLGQVNLAEGAGVNRHRTPKRKDLSNNERSRGAVEQRLAHPGHKSSKRYLARVHVRRRSTALRGSALP